MASRKFEFWSALEIREAIIALEQGISTGAASVSTQGPGGGSVTWTSRENYNALLDELYAAWDRKNGADTKPALTQFRQISKRGY
ncbi:hypothetical protein [Gellertiella hungarica]|uniref:Uncharacterized protein n=1 Tax=Gellertiella hungarica TaxID=1572859 RepID=A0A7W6J3F5_9HYPH|nr:hypothetical protein [Gellertiella hungarica]MBB4064039.1 hypothetical protein [Gellertiella hungarica]